MKKFLNKKIILSIISLTLLVSIIFFVQSNKSSSSITKGIGSVIKQDIIQRVTIAGTVSCQPLKYGQF